MPIHVLCMVGGWCYGVEGTVCGVLTVLCVLAVGGEGGIEDPIRCGHPKQQGMVTVTRIDRSEKKRRISSSCIPWHRSEVANW